MVLLALVMALTLVMGSVSTVSAANPNRILEATINNVNQYDTRISCQYRWEGYNMAYGHSLVFHDDTDGTNFYEFIDLTDHKVPFYGYSGATIQGADISHTYTMTLTLLRKNGSTIITTSDTWTP